MTHPTTKPDAVEHAAVVPPTDRRPYEPPQLRSLGKLAEVTGVGGSTARRKPHG